MPTGTRHEVRYAELMVEEKEDAKEEEELWRSLSVNGPAVSSLGRFRNTLGHVYTPRAQQVSYVRVGVAGRAKCLHRLIAEAFGVEGRSADRNQINHINGNSRDNRLRNLEWSSASENVRHSHRTNAMRGDGRALRSRPVWVRGAASASAEAGAWVWYASARAASAQLGVNETSVRRCALGAQKYVYNSRVQRVKASTPKDCED